MGVELWLDHQLEARWSSLVTLHGIAVETEAFQPLTPLCNINILFSCSLEDGGARCLSIRQCYDLFTVLQHDSLIVSRSLTDKDRLHRVSKVHVHHTVQDEMEGEVGRLHDVQNGKYDVINRGHTRRLYDDQTYEGGDLGR